LRDVHPDENPKKKFKKEGNGESAKNTGVPPLPEFSPQQLTFLGDYAKELTLKAAEAQMAHYESLKRKAELAHKPALIPGSLEDTPEV